MVTELETWVNWWVGTSVERTYLFQQGFQTLTFGYKYLPAMTDFLGLAYAMFTFFFMLCRASENSKRLR